MGALELLAERATRGMSKPLLVLLTSSMAGVAGAAPVVLMPTWANEIWAKKPKHRSNGNIFFMGKTFRF